VVRPAALVENLALEGIYVSEELIALSVPLLQASFQMEHCICLVYAVSKFYTVVLMPGAFEVVLVSHLTLTYEL